MPEACPVGLQGQEGRMTSPLSPPQSQSLSPHTVWRCPSHGAASTRDQQHLLCPQTCPQSPREELRFQSRFFPERPNKLRTAQLGVINQESKGSIKGRQGLNTLSLQELMNQPQGRVKGAPRVVNKWPRAVRGRAGSESQPLHAQDRVAEWALRDGLACADTSPYPWALVSLLSNPLLWLRKLTGLSTGQEKADAATDS